MSRFLSPRLAHLAAYTPGEQPQDRQYVKLNTNESPYPPSPRTQALAAKELERLQLYPDPDCRKLQAALADGFQLEPEQVLCANGSDDILSYVFQAFGDSDHPIAFPDVTYGFYPVYGEIYGVPCRVLPLNSDLTLNPADYFHLGCHIMLANPNAQTGLALPLEQIEAIAASNPDHVLAVDEAYVDFGGDSAARLLPRHENLLVIRTFSKSYSLAGARLGFALGSPDLIGDLNRIKYSTNPYNVNRMTQAAGLAAIEDAGYYQDCCRRIVETRERTRRALLALGMEVTDSKANFLLARCAGIPGQILYSRLKAKGILVRHFQSPRIRDWIRITIGTSQQMQQVTSAIKTILEQEVSL